MIDESDAGVVGEPKRCGISSCANTMIDDVADDRIRPMNTVSTAPVNNPA